jgi:hypothetical protein
MLVLIYTILIVAAILVIFFGVKTALVITAASFTNGFAGAFGAFIGYITVGSIITLVKSVAVMSLAGLAAALVLGFIYGFVVSAAYLAYSVFLFKKSGLEIVDAPEEKDVTSQSYIVA